MTHNLYIFLTLLLSLNLTAQVSDFASVDFTKANNIAKIHEGAKLDNLPLLAYQLTSKLSTDVEKFRAIYTWVSKNIKGDNAQHNMVSKNRKKFKNDSIAFSKWNKQYLKVVFKKLRKYKKTMCTGYAYLIQELCYLANIECVIVDGYGRSVDANTNSLDMVNHSWNAVKLNNKWYLCDATWSSGYTDEYNCFITDYNDGYFLTDPVLFGKSHYPAKKKWLLTDKIITSSFTKAPLIYGETYKHNIDPIAPKNRDVTLRKGEEITFSLKATDSDLNKTVSLVHYIGFKEKKFDISNITNNNGIISFNHKFKHKGNYDAHLKINDDIVATYTVKVIKD